jgi:hypothetical protein
MFGTLKLKLIAAGSAIIVALLAAVRIFYGLNKSKKEKIAKMKQEAKVAEAVQGITRDMAELDGFQEAVSRDSDRLAKKSESEADKRGAIDENDTLSGTTSVTV